MSAQLEDLISKLITRLEGVTQRLEKVEKTIGSGAPGAGAGAASPAAGGAGGDQAAFVTAFEELVAAHLPAVHENAAKIGEQVPEISKLFAEILEEQKKLLIVASKSKKPADADFAKLLQPMMALAQKINAVKSGAPRTSKVPNHLATVAEGIGALNWVTVEKTPGPFIGDMIGGSEFYSNRILKEFKGKDETHVAWVQGVNGILKDIQKYVKQYHTTGLSWKANGGDALAAAASLGGSAAPAAPAAPAGAGGPPPPPKAGPPPPAPPPAAASSSSSSKADADPAALFAQINSGNVTGGLRKVTDDMKAKNRADRTGVVSDVPKKAAAPAKAAGAAKKGPARTALDGNKWCIENHNDGTHEVTATDPKQTVYIYKVDNSIVKINGKINAIIIDSCKKTAVIFENAIASCEVVNSNSIKVQVNKVPSIAIDKTSGCQLFLSKDCLDTEIYTSKSDEMNVVIPHEKEGEDPVELPIPEQFLSKVKGAKLATEPVQHTGA